MLAHKKKIINRTIPYKIVKANSFITRFKGLMFRKNPLMQEALWILPCNSIHMCFMHFPIDVVFLDKNKMIAHLVQNLKPWRFVAPIKEAHSVLECPVGTIEKFSLEIGQRIKM